MLKKFLFIALSLVSGYCFAQNTDSIAVVKATWNKKKIAPKTRLVVHHFKDNTLFLSNQHIAYVEIDNSKRAPLLGLGAEGKTLKTTQVFGAELNALAAINGTFFDVKNGGSVDFIKVNGTVINENRLEKNDKRARHQRAAIVIKNGKLNIKKWDGTPDWEQKLAEQEVMNSGPLLIYNDITEVLDTVAFNRLRHPRSAVGVKADGKILLLTVDGRQENSAGMSLFELTKVMRWLGCVTAINLDGGGSTTLWVNGTTDNGVVNYPSDNKKWDHEGTRKVANVIYLKRKQ